MPILTVPDKSRRPARERRNQLQSRRLHGAGPRRGERQALIGRKRREFRRASQNQSSSHHTSVGECKLYLFLSRAFAARQDINARPMHDNAQPCACTRMRPHFRSFMCRMAGKSRSHASRRHRRLAGSKLALPLPALNNIFGWCVCHSRRPRTPEPQTRPSTPNRGTGAMLPSLLVCPWRRLVDK